MTDREVHRGDIFWCPIIEMNEGGELYSGKPRPVIVVSNEKANETSDWVTIVPITSKQKKPLPIHVEIAVNEIKGTVLCEKLECASKSNLGYFCGELSPEKMKEIDEAVMYQLSLQADTSVRTVKEEVIPPPEAGNAKLKISLISQERDLYKKLYEQLIEKVAGGK